MIRTKRKYRQIEKKAEEARRVAMECIGQTKKRQKEGLDKL